MELIDVFARFLDRAEVRAATHTVEGLFGHQGSGPTRIIVEYGREVGARPIVNAWTANERVETA